MNAQPPRPHEKLRRSLAFLSVVVAVGATASPGCGNSGVVGGGCLEGLTNCSNHCVNLDTDQYNCGHCGNQCVSGVACIMGKCGGPTAMGGTGYGGEGGQGGHYRDGSAGGGMSSSDAQGDHVVEFDVGYPAGGSSSGGGSGGGSSGGSSGSDSGTVGDAGEVDACTPPYNDSLHCGDCFTACPPDKPVCAPSAGTYQCRPYCDPPLVNCGGTCSDINSDSTNCGTCGVICPSGICQGGGCVGVQPGDFVGICMNYRAPATTQTRQLLSNAIFLLPAVSPVRILAYDEYVEPAWRQQVDITIAVAAALGGYKYTLTSVHKNEDVPNILRKTDYDVFLVYEQPKAPAGALSDVGDRWASSLTSYTYVGGVVVALDGGQGINEMSKLFTSTRLFPVSGEIGVSPTTSLVRLGSDVIVRNVVTPFATQADTCAFETSLVPDSNTAFVVTAPTGDAGGSLPVAIHLTRIAPP